MPLKALFLVSYASQLLVDPSAFDPFGTPYVCKCSQKYGVSQHKDGIFRCV